MLARNFSGTVVLHGDFQVADSYFAVEKTSFWGAIVGWGRFIHQAVRSFGSLARLEAAMVIANCARTLSRPR